MKSQKIKVEITCNGPRVAAYVEAAISFAGGAGYTLFRDVISLRVDPFHIDLLTAVCQSASVAAGGYPFDVEVEIVDDTRPVDAGTKEP